jgi:hypothetical protein
MTRPPKSQRRRPLAAGLAVVTALVLIPVSVPSAGGQAETQEALSVASTTTFVGPEDVWSVEIIVPDAPEGSTLSLQLHDRVRGPDDFRRSAEGDGLRPVIRSWGKVPLGDLALGADRTLAIDLQVTEEPTDALFGIRITEPGAYPLVARLENAEGEDLDELVVQLVRLPATSPDAPPAVALAVVVPFAVPQALRPDGTRPLAAVELDRLASLVKALTDHSEVPITVAPSPETLDALAVTDGGTELLEVLAGSLADRAVAPSPWARIDFGDWFASSLDTEVDRQLVAGTLSIEGRLGVSPDGSPWLVDESVDDLALAALIDRGVSFVVIPDHLTRPTTADPSETVASIPPRAFELSTANVGVPAVAVDSALSERLSEPDPVLAVNLLLAEITVIGAQDPQVGQALAVTLPTEATAALDPLLASLSAAASRPGAAPAVVPVTTASLPASTVRGRGDDGTRDDLDGPLTARALATAPGQAIPNYAGDLRRTATNLAALTTMVSIDSQRLALPASLLLASGDRTLAAPQQAALLDAAESSIAGSTDAISVPELGAVTLTSTEGTVPLTIDNALDEPVDVALELVADKLDLPDGSELTTTLAPGSNRVEVPVSARATGAFPLEVTVRSPDGVLVLDRARTTVRSTAVPGLGLVLSIGAGLFLAAWWATHWRRARRSRSLVPEPWRTEGDRTAGGATSAGYAHPNDPEGGSHDRRPDRDGQRL